MTQDISSEPLISIITPTYNRARFLTQAIDSVLEQTYQNFELLVIDDGSDDNTRDVLDNYLQDERIKYIYQNNSGQATARNNGIRNATGDYICFLDSDDYWRPDKLERSLSAFSNNPEASIVYSDMIIVNEDRVEISRYNIDRHTGYITPLLLRDNFISMSTTMVRRDCFEKIHGFNETCRMADDYQLWLRMSVYYYFFYIPDYLAYYRVTSGQISSNIDKRLDINEKIIREFLSDYPKAIPWTSKRRGLSHFYIRKANYLLTIRSFSSVLYNMLTGLFYHPFWLGPWRTLCLLLMRRTS